MSGNALYYPSIEFQDEEFLKKSLLLWDRIFRIVPQSYSPQDNVEVKTAASAGFIVDLNVDQYEKSIAAQRFLDFYRVRRDINNSLSWPAGFSSTSYTRINPDKIDYKLLPLFEELSKRVTYDGFFEVQSELANGYMFYLASQIAENRNIHLLTDTSECWTVGSYFEQKGNFNDDEYLSKVNTYYCNLAIDNLLPDSLLNVSIDDILRFIEKHSEEKLCFQREFESLRNEISKCNTRQHAEYITNDYITKFDRAKLEYRKAVAAFSKRELCSIFSAGLATTMSYLSLPKGGDPYDTFHLSTGILLGAVAALATRELMPSNKGTGSYLVSSERLGARPNWRLYRNFHEFIND